MYSNVEILNIVFRGVGVKKSEIRLKSENLHPCATILRPPLNKKSFPVVRPGGIILNLYPAAFFSFFF